MKYPQDDILLQKSGQPLVDNAIGVKRTDGTVDIHTLCEMLDERTEIAQECFLSVVHPQ